MLQYDPISDLRFWPVPLLRFGQNPHGGPLYRIVFAPSRRELTYGDWSGDGEGAAYAQWTLKYPAAGNIWVMERWVPPSYFRCSKENWPAINGPFPDRGDYELAHEFQACLPDQANIEKLISWIEMSQDVSLYQARVALRRAEEDRLAAQRKLVEDRIRSLLPAYGCRPMFSGGGGKTTIRGTKNDHGPRLRRVRTAQEIGMPARAGMYPRPTPQVPGTINGVQQKIA
jgi:hypothetical protein